MAPPNPPKPALPGLPVDPNPQLDHVKMQRRIDLASEIAQRDGISYPDALLSLDADPSPSAAEDPLYDDVVRDSDQLDRHVQALMVDRETGYVETLDWLEQMAERCWDVSGPLTLSSVLSRGGTTLGRIRTLMAANDEHVRALSTGDPVLDHNLDEQGHALLGPDDDPDALLADPLAPKRAYRRAEELGVLGRYGPGRALGETVGEGPSYAAFEQEWRVYTDNGWDLVATLQMEAQGHSDALAAVDAAQRLEDKILRDRADRQAAERKRIDEADEKLRREVG